MSVRGLAASPAAAAVFALLPLIGTSVAVSFGRARNVGQLSLAETPKELQQVLTAGLLVTQVVFLLPLILWLDAAGWPPVVLFPSIVRGEFGTVAIVSVFLLSLVLGLLRWLMRMHPSQPNSGHGVMLARSRPAIRTFPFPQNLRYLPLALACGAITAIYEEVAFRGALQLSLAEQFGTPVGIAGSALLFGAAHAVYGASRILFTTVAGFAFGVAFAYLHDLTPLVVAHLVFNVAGILQGYFKVRRHERVYSPYRDDHEQARRVSWPSSR